MQEEQQLRNRFRELAGKAYEHNQYQFTDFLNVMEISLLNQCASEFSQVPFSLFGGYNGSERQMAGFGSKELFGYEKPFPLVCIRVQPLLKKFSDELSHRDFLGALMNLGIERSKIGDIVVQDREAYVFCTELIAPYICDNLDKVKHTHMKCSITDQAVEEMEEDCELMEEIVSSLRIDVILAKIYHLSRSQSLELFRAKKVFVNSRLNENNDYLLKENDSISVRGFGRAVYEGVLLETKKEKLKIRIRRYR